MWASSNSVRRNGVRKHRQYIPRYLLQSTTNMAESVISDSKILCIRVSFSRNFDSYKARVKLKMSTDWSVKIRT